MSESNSLQQAKICFASGQLEESLDLFTSAEKEGVDLLDIWMSRGAAEMALGLYDEAKEDFDKLLTKDPDSERGHYFRGIAHVALGKYKQAIDDLTFSLIRNNDRGIAHLARGIAYANLGEQNDAKLDFNSATAFSDAELKSFKKLFGESADPFKDASGFFSKENAPWNNLLSKKKAQRLSKLLQ